MNLTTPNSNIDTLHPLLTESIERFLTEYRKGATDFSNFASIFFRFMQNSPDPPLEIVWFYSALTFHSTEYTIQDSSEQVIAVKGLFQLLVSCSSSCNAAKKISMLAPVIYELYNLVINEKVPTKNVESLLEGIVSYISICCADIFGENDEFEGLKSCFAALLRVWLVGKVGDGCKFGECLRMFCPIVSNSVQEEMIRGRCGFGHLAGIVMIEAFLLRLCLKFASGFSRAELGKELHNCAVQMITAFRSYYYVDILLKMLLEPVLPVIPLLNSEDEAFLHEILYDAAIMVDFSFFSPQKGIQLSCGQLKNLAVTWLVVADNAIRFVREISDKTKLNSYVQALSESWLVSELINWVMNQPGMQSKTIKPNVSTPVSLLKWLLIVEDQGVRVYDSDISRIYAKAIICKSRNECEPLVDKSDCKTMGENHFSYTGNEVKREGQVDGDLEMVDSMDTKMAASNGTRKRKDGRQDKEDKLVKLVKCCLNDSSVGTKNIWSEIDNPVFDESIEYMEQ